MSLYTHSRTIPNTPLSSNARASLINFFFSTSLLPFDLNLPLAVCGVIPICPNTGILFLTK